jgi:hypothetical protein
MALQHKRSSIANKRPDPTSLSDGQLAINLNILSTGLFYRDSSNALVKVGPVHIGATAPNASPPVGGATGNAVGEQWIDTTGGTYVLKTWDGISWTELSVVEITGATGSATLPSGTEAQRDGSPSAGYIRFNTDSTQFEGYNGTSWTSVGGGATGGGSDAWAVEHDNTVTTSYTITTGKNVISAGPITINSGAVVTVPSGSTWVVA